MSDCTPGPWEATRCETDDGVGWDVTGPVERWMERGGSSAPYYTEADARLIAAAPEMAEFLDEIAEVSDPNGFIAQRARVLLSRIRGEA